MHGLEMKYRKGKIPLKCWCFLTVNCSTTNCWIRFKHSMLSCAKTVLTKGVTPFHWGSVEKLIQTMLDTYQGKLILLLHSPGGPSRKDGNFSAGSSLKQG